MGGRKCSRNLVPILLFNSAQGDTLGTSEAVAVCLYQIASESQAEATLDEEEHPQNRSSPSRNRRRKRIEVSVATVLNPTA
jgi:hypothetical protein